MRQGARVSYKQEGMRQGARVSYNQEWMRQEREYLITRRDEASRESIL